MSESSIQCSNKRQSRLTDSRVKNKMEKGDGMSFAEFTYPLLQGWDWWHMYQSMGVQVQIGGSDQYGNIIAGMDAVRYIAQSRHDGPREALPEEGAPMGLTVPLLTTSSGEKFGKSAGNAIWLDRTMTSPFDLYGVCAKRPSLVMTIIATNRITVPPAIIGC